MRKILLVLCLVVLTGQKTLANTQNESVVIGKKLSMYSKVLEEERSYWVHLPNNYNENERYPVVYLLDGDWHFESTVGVLTHMSRNGRIPQMLVVALPNTDRIRDFTPTREIDDDGNTPEFFKTSGGAEAFLNFIKTELMSKIQQDYSTEPHSIIVGHSLGGLFALYALLEEPDLFQSYVSIDPSIWWDKEWLNNTLGDKLDQVPQPKSDTSVYIASANSGRSDGEMIGPQRNFYAKISTWNNDIFHADIEYFPTENHGSVPLIALHNGLSTIYKGFSIDMSKLVEDPTTLSSHYDNWSKKLGYHLQPPEWVVNFLGHKLMNQGKIDQAIDYFKQNIEMYSHSSNTYGSLAEAYMNKGETALAIEYYQKVIELDGPSERVENVIKTLQEKL